MTKDVDGITSFHVLSIAMKNAIKALVDVALASEPDTDEQTNATVAASVLMAWVQKIDEIDDKNDNPNNKKESA